MIPQVGVSAYRIDLGVVHPDNPGRYLAGIECDGAMYHSSAFARERDKIRQSMLEGLGWKILRIWSTEWWLNKSRELERIDNDLRHLLEQERRHSSNLAALPEIMDLTRKFIIRNYTLESVIAVIARGFITALKIVIMNQTQHLLGEEFSRRKRLRSRKQWI